MNDHPVHSAPVDTSGAAAAPEARESDDHVTPGTQKDGRLRGRPSNDLTNSQRQTQRADSKPESALTRVAQEIQKLEKFEDRVKMTDMVNAMLTRGFDPLGNEKEPRPIIELKHPRAAKKSPKRGRT